MGFFVGVQRRAASAGSATKLVHLDDVTRREEREGGDQASGTPSVPTPRPNRGLRMLPNSPPDPERRS